MSPLTTTSSNERSSEFQLADDPTKPFVVTSKVYESHSKPIYAVAFNNYLPEDAPPIFATATERYVNVYECPLDSKDINLLLSMKDATEKEDFFALSWCYDTYEEINPESSPYMLAVGGLSGVVRILRSNDAKLVNHLRGHGESINEIRVHPSNSMLIATASKDYSIRVWHIRNDSCLMVLGGFSAHKDQVLSVDWSRCGDFLASCSMDHTIRLWKVNTGNFENKMNKLISGLSEGKKNFMHNQNAIECVKNLTSSANENQNSFVPDQSQERSIVSLYSRITQTHFDEPIISHFPISMIDDLHTDYVDCIRFIGDFCLSKGSGAERICKNQDTVKWDTCALKLSEKNLPHGDVWFVKMEIDPQNKWLACGDKIGVLNFFMISAEVSRSVTQTLFCGFVLRKMFRLAHRSIEYFKDLQVRGKSKVRDLQKLLRNFRVEADTLPMIGIKLMLIAELMRASLVIATKRNVPSCTRYKGSCETHPQKNRLMSESEWRSLGIQQSAGWIHYMIHSPERHVLLFRRPITTTNTNAMSNANSNAVGVR
ncbi:unnamed protein product [Caenorhabditis auriculariae]|uniref:Cyclin-dependent kinases regulatory subunit n=1 Tax=Caenorhabditis auriculariae TaxID=2777116 RepID=A0A8S1H793_9PELO|nr:unnamed protein product [Caenorhabditis auriculariae]